MPTYHYRCKSCKYEFEEFQKMSDDPLKVCPECHKHTVVRVLSGGTGLVFKGSGFYITDYKGKSPSSSKNESKSETKSASNPEAKSSDTSKKSDGTIKKE